MIRSTPRSNLFPYTSPFRPRAWAARFGFARTTLLCFLEAIALALQRDDLSAMHEPVDQSDHASGIGEDLIPFSKHFVGSECKDRKSTRLNSSHLVISYAVYC